MQPDTEKNQKALTFWQNKKKTYKSNLTVPIERERAALPNFPVRSHHLQPPRSIRHACSSVKETLTQIHTHTHPRSFAIENVE